MQPENSCLPSAVEQKWEENDPAHLTRAASFVWIRGIVHHITFLFRGQNEWMCLCCSKSCCIWINEIQLHGGSCTWCHVSEFWISCLWLTCDYKGLKYLSFCDTSSHHCRKYPVSCNMLSHALCDDSTSSIQEPPLKPPNMVAKFACFKLTSQVFLLKNRQQPFTGGLDVFCSCKSGCRSAHITRFIPRIGCWLKCQSLHNNV